MRKIIVSEDSRESMGENIRGNEGRIDGIMVDGVRVRIR